MHYALTQSMLLTMVVAISAGVFLVVLSRRINVSAIVLLLAGGVLLGPEGMGLVVPRSLGEGLPVLVSLSVGLILFEGGLTLDLRGYRTASAVIHRLLSVGLLTTWLSVAAALWVIFRFDFAFSLLAASLVVVTGPTVIAPLLRRIKVKAHLHSILHWEGVLIDPLGVFVAILCFEWMGAQSRGLVLARFVLRFVWGFGLGLAGGLAVYRLLKSRFIPDDMVNVFALAFAVLIFGLAESLFPESGLLSVTVAGFVLGTGRPGEIKEIRRFKAEITDLLIGMLFILLSARLNLDAFLHFGPRGLLAVAFVLLVARPLNILFSSWGLGLPWREKCFLSWVAPRGIVAASMASIFTLHFQQKGGVPQAAFLETFTYSVIVTTVVLQGISARALARVLGVLRPAPTGWLIVGAHALGRRIAHFITHTAGHRALLLDTNPHAVAEARAEGLEAMQDDARDPDLEEEDVFQDIGTLLALTDNEDMNILLCQRWAEVLGRDRVFYWSSGGTDAEAYTGVAVWSRLPKPSRLSGELERGTAVLMNLGAPVPDAGDTPLLVVREGTVRPEPEPGEDLGGEDLNAVLLLRREADYLCASLRPERVLHVRAQSREDLFEQMAARFVEGASGLSGAGLVGDLLERERAFPTALGHGVAVPHAYVEGLDSRLCAVAQVPEGVDFGALDGEPVRLVFLLLSPPGDPEGHLETLAEIARLVGNEKAREHLLAAGTPGELFRAIQQFS